MINWRRGDSGRFPQWNKQPQQRERRTAFEYTEPVAHEPSYSDLQSRSKHSDEEKLMTEEDKAMLRDLDLLDDDESNLPMDEFNPVLKANPLESFSLERERSRELEKNELNKRESNSKSQDSSIGPKRRLKKAVDIQENFRMTGEKNDFQARIMNKKLENLKKNTGLLADQKTRRASESTKPSLNLMIPKGFETKESFSRRFKVLESLGEGGSSIVRKVSCRRDGKICAVKSCKSNDESSTKYIKKELKILQSLSHPNIIKPYGIFESTSNVDFQLNRYILFSSISMVKV